MRPPTRSSLVLCHRGLLARTLILFSLAPLLVALGGCAPAPDAAETTEGAVSFATVIKLARDAGLPCSQLVTAAAIAMAESGLNPRATNYNTNGSVDRGLWQVNSIHPYSASCLFDPACNARAMRAISGNGSNWHPWVTYNLGLHKPFLDDAKRALDGLWLSGCSACPRGNGLYCGGNGVPGDRNTLYRCSSGGLSVAQHCAAGCSRENTPSNFCECPRGNGTYCGGDGVNGSSKNVYRCTRGAVSIAERCEIDCVRTGTTSSRCVQPPRGNLEAADCGSIRGWAQDPESATAATTVEIYYDGPVGTGTGPVRVSANDRREALCASLGSCDHGFELPTPAALRDGREHTVHAYVLDRRGGNRRALNNAPRRVRCALFRADDVNGDGRDDVVQYRGDWTSAPTCISTGSGWSCRNLAASYVAGALRAGNGGSGIYEGGTPLLGDLDADGSADLIQYRAESWVGVPACISLGTGWSCKNLAASYVGGTGAGNDGSGVYAASVPLLADFDADGRNDLIQYNARGNSLPVCLSLGTGWSCRSLAASYTGGAGAGNEGSGIYAGATPLVGDFDGDRRADVVQFDPRASTIPVCLSLGTGWSCRNLPVSFTGGAPPSAAAGTTALLGDFNGDGRADLVQFNPAWTTLPVCLSLGTGWSCRNLDATYTGAAPAPTPGTRALVGDFNGDGRTDLVQFNPAWTTLPVCLSLGTGWSCRDLPATYTGGTRGAGLRGSAVYPLAIPLMADVDGDGRKDLVQTLGDGTTLPVCFALGTGWSCRDLPATYAGGSGAGRGGSGLY